jgi:hypothetical protein
MEYFMGKSLEGHLVSRDRFTHLNTLLEFGGTQEKKVEDHLGLPERVI